MATGADILVTGGTSMKNVVAVTDSIEAIDFNKPNQNMGSLLGSPPDLELGLLQNRLLLVTDKVDQVLQTQ